LSKIGNVPRYNPRTKGFMSSHNGLTACKRTLCKMKAPRGGIWMLIVLTIFR